jgi:putative sigma-54 modulation protein
MRVTFSGKSVSSTDRERDYAEKKLQRLARYFNSAREAHVVHSVQRNFQIVEVMVDLDGTLLRGEGRTPDFFASVDEVTDKLENQVRRLKERIKQHKGRADAPTVAAAIADSEEEEESRAVAAEAPAAVVRRKRFAIKPMTVDEAMLRMELLHHDFFAFLNDETDQVGILYRRHDGDYGLLELET